MTDGRDLSEGFDPAAAEAAERAAEKRKAQDQAFADKLAKRPPPHPVERAEIEKARKRTKARAPRIAVHIEDRGKAGSQCSDPASSLGSSSARLHGASI